MHLNGWGTPRNLQQAQYYFSMAAKVHHTLGTYNLAMMHLARDAASCPLALELLKRQVPPLPYIQFFAAGLQ